MNGLATLGLFVFWFLLLGAAIALAQSSLLIGAVIGLGMVAIPVALGAFGSGHREGGHGR